MAQKEHSESRTFNLKSEVYEWFEAIVFAVTTVVILFTFIFRVVGVEGQSMQNTLNKQYIPNVNEVEDRIIITNLFYTPKQGDIVVCALPGQIPIIKRVIGVAGDQVNVAEDGTVTVNGKVIEESYVKDEPYENSYSYCKFPLQVKAGTIFVMGDNRNNSKDSRYSDVGCIKTEYVLGHAIFRIYPFDTVGSLTAH